MSKQKNLNQRLWDFFCSLKLAIVTLLLLAVTSIIGTVIQQNRSPQEYMQTLGISESTYRLLDALQFFNMYHSWWFLSLMGCFAVNLICCSIKRLPRIIKTVREPILTADEGLFNSLADRGELTVSADMAAVRDKMTGLLSRRFSTPVVTERDGKVFLFAQKGTISRFGVYVTHFSILVIFLGAMIGNVWGFKGYVNIPEGETINQIWLRSGDKQLAIDFDVRCDDFDVSFYDGGGRPKEYTSDLVVIENGKEVLKKRIEVNDPLTYKGLTFYQSSYGQAGEPTYQFKVKNRATGEVTTVAGQQGAHLPLSGGASLIPMGYAQNYQNFGPAAQVNIDVGDHQHGTPFIVLQNFPQFDERRGGDYIVTLISGQQSFFTGLQVVKDPGVWVVWAGCLLLVLGSLIAFFLSHRRIWVRIEAGAAGTDLQFGGNAHRNQPAFALFFDDFKQDVRDAFVS